MTIHGLNTYQSHLTTDRGFRNFQWVLPGVLARSAQPNYSGKDESHDISFLQADFLKKKGISCVISSNQYELPDHSKTLLATYGIAYYHFRIEDYHAASPQQLKTAADIIEANRRRGATLVHCGFGEGRTGTIVAAWAMMKHMPTQAGVNINTMCTPSSLKDNFGVETPHQTANIRAAANLPATPYPPGLGFQAVASASGGSAQSFSGPGGIGMPNAASVPSINFSSIKTDDIEW
ncbi:protein-tyrosine phosphatase family protein [Simiduia curdlanivorans]|uniref:Dual specificity protein phosphatase family protein n=1 Tax=Simiduia curdlanivorans TaxID=1492769 RepID=A0ABV8V445_9GAMM|nr:dual specificity protein phosphatase family protein [Simiduia curdlanivorans]MDN3637379.1 protein-tyrosine phosphatase family protein [Simiduia curdlanivorans]